MLELGLVANCATSYKDTVGRGFSELRF